MKVDVSNEYNPEPADELTEEVVNDEKEVRDGLNDEFGPIALVLLDDGYVHDADDCRKCMREAYRGSFPSMGAWARVEMDALGLLDSVPESLRDYIDYERWASDQESEGEIFAIDTGAMLPGLNRIHVFRAVW